LSEESKQLNRRDENARRAGLLSNASSFVSYFLILLPAVLALLYVRAYGVSVVYFDAWSVVRLFDKWSSGTLSPLDLLEQHNEHRMFFPKGFELLLGWITGYDNVVEMYVIQVCFLATLIILLLAFRDNVRAWLFIFAPVAFLIFSFRQYENILFGFQINFAFTQTFGVLALFLLYVVGHTRLGKLAFVAALGSDTIATFSTAQGLFVWPAGLLQLFLSPVEKRTKRVLISVFDIGMGPDRLGGMDSLLRRLHESQRPSVSALRPVSSRSRSGVFPELAG
jgi:hypothetical protein